MKLRGLLGFALPAVDAVGLLASSVLVSTYQPGSWIPCGASDGCAAVAVDDWSHVGPVPTPWIGAAFFLLAFLVDGAAFAMGRRTGRIQILLGAAGAVGGIAWLLRSALVVHAFCPWCAACSFSSVAGLAIRLFDFDLGESDPEGGARLRGLLLAGLAAATMGGFALVERFRPSRWAALHVRQDLIARLSEAELVGSRPWQRMNEAQKSRGTVAAYMDFTCPTCRSLFPMFLKAARKGRLRFVLRVFPGRDSDLGWISSAGALALHDQERYWRFCEKAFASTVNEDSVQEWLEEAGASLKTRQEIAAGLSGPPYEAVREELAFVKKAGIKATPTFLLLRPGREAVPLSPLELEKADERF